MERTILFIVLFLVTSFVLQGQCEDRYITSVFDTNEITIDKDILFGTNEDYEGNSIDLLLDIYYPTDDWLEARPVIMVAHGGAFVNGSKNDSLIYGICTDLAKRGLVAVPFSYRLDNLTNLLSPEDMTEENIVKAAIRGIQDGKAAVRYIRQTTDVSNPYKIDTSKIYMLGISAGGLIATHMAYLDDDDELPENWPQYLEDLDGWGGTSGNEAYSSHIDGVINAAGALGNPEFIDEDEVPIVSFHSVYDPIVPYHIERPLYGYLGSVPEYWPLLYGSEQIHKRANLLSIDNKIYTFCDDNHVHYNPSDDYTFEDRLVDYAKLYEFLQLSVEFLSPYLYYQEIAPSIPEEECITVVNESGESEVVCGVINDYSTIYDYHSDDSLDCFVKCITTIVEDSIICNEGTVSEVTGICEIGISEDYVIQFENCYYIDSLMLFDFYDECYDDYDLVKSIIKEVLDINTTNCPALVVIETCEYLVLEGDIVLVYECEIDTFLLENCYDLDSAIIDDNLDCGTVETILVASYIDSTYSEIVEICETVIFHGDTILLPNTCRIDTLILIGINPVEILPAQVYPNPVQDILTINVEDHNPYTWKLYEQTGRLIRFGNGQGLTQIERGNLSTGMYYLQLESEDEITTKKIVFE